MPEIIKASEHNLNSVFSDDYLFEIPLYQRPYAWTTEQVDELLDDLLNAMDRDAQSPYFLGSVVLIKKEGDSKSAVVDGQQRLTTLSMLFCVLRELADGNAQFELDGFVREAGNSLRGTQDRFRLGLRARDREFFHDNVQSRGAIPEFLKKDNATFSDSQKLIFTNVNRLNQELSKLSESRRGALVKFVIQQCYLVVVTATDRDSAYRIFSVMNDRGLDLSPTDILKAETIGEIPEPDQEVYGEKWENIEERIGREGFRDLFAHIRMVTLKTKLRRTLQADFQDNVLKNAVGKEFIDHTLEPYASVYETLMEASYESTQDAEKLNDYLRHLSRLDNFDWIPPAMAFFLRHANDRESLIRFTKDLERLAYGLFVRRANVNDRINRYAEVLRDIERGSDLFDDDSPLQLKADEQDEIVKGLNGQIYLQTAVVRRTLLERLDSLLADTGATYTRTTITVEHVLPQNPKSDSEWMKWFPSQDQRDTWTHRLANLVLLSRRKNASASNWDFGRKKTEYFQRGGVAPFALTAQVLNESDWTPVVLDRRQKELVDSFRREWRLA
ncbi:MAG: DUF262 domain-containing HNH endonuclease family protein [Chloroflexi bacterium]|nr:DUF262 domain-containing HNH endonuclease family protein [Chloroflexota bacterium]